MCLQRCLTHHVPASYIAIYPQFLNPGTAPDSAVLCYLTRACQLSLSHSISTYSNRCVCGEGGPMRKLLGEQARVR